MKITICNVVDVPPCPKIKTVKDVLIGHGFTLPHNHLEVMYVRISAESGIWFHTRQNMIGCLDWNSSQNLPIKDEFVVDFQLSVKKVD